MTKRWLAWALACGSLVMAAPVFAEDNSMANTRVRYYRNVSSADRTSHEAVIFSLTDSDTSTGTDDTSTSTIGFDVETTTLADNAQFVGVILDGTCPAGQVCRVAVEGPVLVRFAQATDGTQGIGGGVGTTTVAGMLGAGTGAGRLLSRDTGSESACQSTEANGTAAGCDGELRWVYLRGQDP